MKQYDGSRRWAEVEAALGQAGYITLFACARFDKPPAELNYTGTESGWELRRKIKSYCSQNGIADYQIVRNTSYLSDLHGGAVYELWVRRPTKGPT